MPLIYKIPYPEHQGWWEWDWFHPEEHWSYEETIAPEIPVPEDYSREWTEWQMICFYPGIARRVSEIHRSARFNALDKFIVREWEYGINLKLALDRRIMT